MGFLDYTAFCSLHGLCGNDETGCFCYDGSVGPDNVSGDMVLTRGKSCGIRAKGEVVGHLHFDTATFFRVLLHLLPWTGVDTRLCC